MKDIIIVISVDKTNLQIQSYEAVIMKTVNLKTEEEIIAKAKVSYNKKVKVPGFDSEIKDANVNNRKCDNTCIK